MDWLNRVWSGERSARAAPPAADAQQPPSEGGVVCPGYRIEEGLDYLGADIGQGPRTVGDVRACCSACESTKLCNAYTYVLATQECWLKSRRRGAKPEAQPGSLVSAFRQQLKPRSGQLSRLRPVAAGAPRVRSAAARASGGGDGGGGGGYLRRQQEAQIARLLEQASPVWQDVDDEQRSALRLSLPLADAAAEGPSASAVALWGAPDAAPMQLVLAALDAAAGAPPALRWRAESTPPNETAGAGVLHRAALAPPAGGRALVLQLLPAAAARRGAPRRYRVAAHALPALAERAPTAPAPALGFVLFGSRAAAPPLVAALRAELLGFGAALALHTGDLCAPVADAVDAADAPAGAVRRCLAAVAPLAAAAPLMPAPGPADAPLAGCGGAWAERWWTARLEAGGGGGGCGEGGAPWYSFVRGPVLFVVLSSAHPTDDGGAQHRFAQRAARLRPAGGWTAVLAHAAAAAEPAARALHADVLLAAECPRARGGRPCVAPPPDGYARLRVRGGGGGGGGGAPRLDVERVRAADGAVLGRQEIRPPRAGFPT